MIRFTFQKVGLNILVNQSTTMNFFFNNAIILEYYKTNTNSIQEKPSN